VILPGVYVLFGGDSGVECQGNTHFVKCQNNAAIYIIYIHYIHWLSGWRIIKNTSVFLIASLEYLDCLIVRLAFLHN